MSEPRAWRRPAACLVLVFCFGAGVGLDSDVRAQEPLRLDRSNGSVSGTVWLVASRPGAEAAALFAGVGIARLPKGPLERSFALRVGDAGPEVGRAGDLAELVGAERAGIEIQVGPRAYDEVRHLVARWEEGEQEETPPPARAENLLDRVARTIGLKAPYRSVLSGVDPVLYLRDLARINGGG